MKNLKKTGIILLLLFLIALAGVFWVFNKPHRNIQSANADFRVEVKDWVAEFVKQDSLAHATYFEKIIELTGEVEQVQQADSVTIITFKTSEEGFQLSCMMDPLERSAVPAKESVRLKCLYAGYLSPDQEFELPGDIKCKNCFLLNEQP